MEEGRMEEGEEERGRGRSRSTCPVEPVPLKLLPIVALEHLEQGLKMI